ncbi:metallophosphoesterase [Paenibacillus sp. EC2-1]|uniref:metallophosphoesterase n=1 Tax=Paenibacillus sp. EC2-1 TaxID=3388665 RepID=UPI003BEEE005
MKLLKYLCISFVVLILLTCGCIFYAFQIEPYNLQIKEYTLNETRADTNEITIVQISDLHIKKDFTYENLANVVETINAQKPDIVIFTGDLYDNYAKYNDDNNLIKELQKIEAKYNKISIWGNRDYGGGAVRQYATIMEQSGFTLLTNKNLYVTLDNGKKILFTGLDDSLLGNPFMPDSTKMYDSDYDILLTHEPDAAINYLNYNYDIILSGHSHGGQFNIPFLPVVNEMAVTSTRLSTEYSGGMYTLKSDTDSTLYVNTGIGTTHISARFGVVPEVAVFHIYI